MPNVEMLLTLQQIEQRYGYARGSLTSVRAKGGMPAPDQQYGRTPLWRAANVEAWINNRRKVVK